jgi:alcohol dehydrogenase class IV
MLKSVMEYSFSGNLARYADIAAAMGENIDGFSEREAALRSIEGVENLAIDLGVPTKLREMGIPREAIPKMAEDASRQTRLILQNPRRLGVEDIEKIYHNAW